MYSCAPVKAVPSTHRSQFGVSRLTVHSEFCLCRSALHPASLVTRPVQSNGVVHVEVMVHVLLTLASS